MLITFLRNSMKKTLLSNITYNKNDIDIILDKDKDDLERTKERENHLRQANLKIRDLEDKIKDLSLGKYDEDILPNILSKLNDIEVDLRRLFNNKINNAWSKSDQLQLENIKKEKLTASQLVIYKQIEEW